MPAAPLDPTTGPDGAPASVGLRTWLTIGAGLLLFVLVPFALLGTLSAAYALAGPTASATGSMLPAIAGAIVLPALVMGGASLARRRSRGRCEPTQT
jgi:hypothetical protein